MTEDNATESPAPLHTTWPGRHHTPVSDADGAAVPGKGSDFFIRHFLREVTALLGHTNALSLGAEVSDWRTTGWIHKRSQSVATVGNLNLEVGTDQKSGKCLMWSPYDF